MVIECIMVALLCFNAGVKIATTEDGKKVILLQNGTWKYATTDDIDSMERTVREEQPTAKAEDRITLVDIVKNDEKDDFRAVRWGMSRAEVKSLEKAKLLNETKDKINYEVNFMGYACKVVYAFVNEKLQKADLLISQDHADPAKYYKDYEDLNRYLTPIYGRPVTEIKDWKNDMYKSDQSRYGFAISIGFLTCKTVWNNQRSQVTLSISGGNHLIKTNLEYIGLLQKE